ncbi:ABC transporter permease subunit [Ignisphaera sp. 4213-co]|uniref:ABC transporter permease subunit n=1 Tax=Ignisphaera cupida TaxID=3050454 RepID=A0ABD4Z670_9CREN|nr:ABC transporter permease subunit [Ignisphaera sp. 4213-co]MDK6028497.1 ABC transporter permease subunit [Ignisphaera sp. 4213-co]
MGYRELIRDKVFIVALAVFLFIVLFSIIHLRYFVKTNPGRWYQVPQGLPPSLQYPFGTTLTGQNLFDVIPAALLNSLTIGFVTASVSILITIVLASTTALIRRGISIILTFIDIMSSLPPLPALITLVFAWRDIITLPMIGLILSIFGWAWPSRALVSLLISLKERTFIYTSYLTGAPKYTIVLKDFIPYTLRYLLVNFVNLVLWAIGMETTVAMFGAMKMEVPTIGTTLYWALRYQSFLLGLWWWYTIPTIFLVIVVVTLYIIGIKIDEHIFYGGVA